jgi:hypothetical protein
VQQQQTTGTLLFNTSKKGGNMDQIYMKSEELKKLFQPDLESIYEIDIKALQADILVNGVLSPVTLSKDSKLIDGYRRVLAAEKAGCRKIPYIISDLEATVENRVILNQYREKTWMDKRYELLDSFKTFGNKQGKKLPNGYNRYEEISKRTKFRLTDIKSLRRVENILQSDEDGYPFSYWLIEKKSDLDSIEKIMDWRQKGEYPEVVQQVLRKELSPKAAVKLIEAQIANSNLSSYSFKLPTSNSSNIVLHSGNEEEVMKMLESKNAKMIYYEPDVCTVNFDLSYDSQRDKNHLASVYAMRVANRVKPYVNNRLDGEGSFFIGVREFYSDGIARQLPSEVIRHVEKETGLVYKQTIICTSGDGFAKVNKRNNLSDPMIHFLWFVKSKDAKIAGSIVPIYNKEMVDPNAPLIYKQCSNYIDKQVVRNVIVNNRDKNSLIDPASVMPIFFCTKEKDLVVDLSMKGSFHTAATIMNRAFIGLTSDHKQLDAGNKEIAETMESFSKPHLEKVFGKNRSKSQEPAEQELMEMETV